MTSHAELDHLSNWIELPALNLARAKAFYEKLLATELMPFEAGGNRYALFPARNPHNTGALVQGPGYTPSETGPLVYLDGAGRMDELLGRVVEAGGTILLPKTFFSDEAGDIAIFRDPEGNRVGLQAPVKRAARGPVADDVMQGLLASTPPAHAFLLRKGPAYDDVATQPLQWEHARNMFTLLRDGHLRYVCALMDGTDVVGFGVMNGATREAVEALLRADPAVRAGRLAWQLLAGVAFTAGETRL
jgi:predicted enzyme related to lactoylglutathione lyase